MQFSLFYFANYEGAEHAQDKYQLMQQSAKWADKNDFAALWIPERHFHTFGGLSPNPSVLGAALASITERIRICSGSVVLPLHDPIRVAEEWAVVDNISNGRVGLGVACGWVPNDFVISDSQANFDNRKEVFAKNVSTLRKLLRGETLTMTNPQGKEIHVQTLPRPVQEEIPMWITAAANPETFRQAGEMGANLLTHLLGQTMQGLAEKIDIYRDAWEAAEHPGRGTMTLMLHTYVGDSDDAVHDLVREPMKKYLGSSLSLAAAHVKSVPFLRNADNIDASALTPEMIDEALEFSFEKYLDEIACLIDYGLDTETILAGLENLNAVRTLANSEPDGGERRYSTSRRKKGNWEATKAAVSRLF
jgi:natural product biosynthesis luciferase-like monooxygenase protein